MWPLMWPRVKPDASRRHLQAAPVGQPAYSQFVTQAASARGWFFAKIAEPATKTPITRVSATIFVMSPSAPGAARVAGHRCCSGRK